MFILRLVRKAGKFVRGGASPLQIILGALLGVFIGFISGFNLTLLVAILALIMLNAHLGTTLIGMGIGQVCSMLLAPLTFRIGYFIVHEMGAEGLFSSIFNAPVLALSGLDRYSMIGAVPIAILITASFAYFMVKSINSIRAIFYEEGESRPFVQKITRKKPVKLFIRVLLGKKKDLVNKKPVLRKKGLILVLVIVTLFAGFDLFALSPAFKKGAVSAFERFNGAEVNVENAVFSLLRGQLRMEGLQFTDPEKPQNNRLNVDKMVGNLSIWDLLAKRLVVREMTLEGVLTDTMREEAGEVFTTTDPEPEPEVQVDPEEPILFDYFKDTERIEKIANYAAKALEKQRERTKEKQEQKEEPREFIFETAENIGYLNTSAAELLREYPAFSIQHIHVKDIAVWAPLDGNAVTITNISSSPALSGQATEISIMPGGENGREVAWLRLNLQTLESPHQLRVDIHDLSVGEGTDWEMSEMAKIQIANALVNLNAQGKFDTGMLDIPFSMKLSHFEFSLDEGENLFGLDPALSEAAMSALDTLPLYGTLYGQILSPRISFDTSKTASEIKENLFSAGAAQAIKSVLEEHREKLGVEGERLLDMLDDEKNDLNKEKVLDALETQDVLDTKSISDFLGNDKDGESTEKEGEGEKKEREESDSIEDAIKSLF